MTPRAHAVALSLVLGAAAAAGSYAVISTVGLGDGDTKPQLVADKAVSSRAKKLDAWGSSLRSALAARPPALPAVPRYGSVDWVSAPAGGALPTVAATAKTHSGTAPSGRTRPSSSGARQSPAPVKGNPPNGGPAAAPTVPVSAPSPTPAPTPVSQGAPAVATTPSASTEQQKQSAEAQCEALKRAAEGQGEAAKQAAEEKCEALKKAAEGNG